MNIILLIILTVSLALIFKTIFPIVKIVIKSLVSVLSKFFLENPNALFAIKFAIKIQILSVVLILNFVVMSLALTRFLGIQIIIVEIIKSVIL